MFISTVKAWVKYLSLVHFKDLHRQGKLRFLLVERKGFHREGITLLNLHSAFTPYTPAYQWGTIMGRQLYTMIYTFNVSFRLKHFS